MGFEKCIRSILEKILEKQEGLEKFMLNNQQRQNVLASATLNRDVDRLVSERC
jgi:superfamily II DNA/RNA helicase